MNTTTKKTIEIDGVTLHLSQPDNTRSQWIGQEEVLKQIQACWMVISEKDFPLSPRITGMPGIGKTTLAMVAANLRNQPLLYGTNRRVDSFPNGLQDAIRGTTGEFFGIPMPPPQVRQAEETIKFQRPRGHEDRIRALTGNVSGFRS